MCALLMLFIISADDPKLISELSEVVDEKLSVQALQNTSKREVRILKAAVGGRCSLRHRTSCGTVSSSYDLMMKCSPTSVSAL